MPPLDAVVLAGGLGTRLATTVPHLPKALAPIQGTPFLDIVLHQLLSSKAVSRIFFALGHKASHILSFLEQKKSPIPLIPLLEESPLGTAGALLHAYPHTVSDPLLVLNGDSFFDLAVSDFLQFHLDHKSQATLAIRYMDDASRYGSIQCDAAQRILSFQEKSTLSSAGWINAGIYLFQRNLLAPHASHAPPLSLEKDLFPSFIASGISAYPHRGTFIDIGTATSYVQAQDILKPWTLLCKNVS